MLQQFATKRDGLMNPQNYNFHRFYTGKILMLIKKKHPYESTNLATCALGDLWYFSSDKHQL